jgi:hypothetical protein
VELPTYPSVEAESLPDESPLRQTAVALLVLQAVLLTLTLPVQALMFLSLGWEGGDEALKHRMAAAMPLLGFGAVVAAFLAGFAAPAVWRARPDGLALTKAAGGLVAALAVGWALAWRGAPLDATTVGVWLVLTLPAPTALALVLRLHARAARR